MTGQSLFPDEYPPRPSEHRPHRRLTCCTDIPGPFGHPDRLWRIVHILGHTRTPFSSSTVAAMADVADGQALTAIYDAIELEWIEPTPTEPYLRYPLVPTWYGRLPKRT